MSFRYKRKVITMGNYKEVFGVCSPDVLDEIRSALLDDTPIAAYIEPCGTDSYKLGQIRMAIREGVPAGLISSWITGKTMYNIRRGVAAGIDMGCLVRYFGVLDEDILEKLSEFVLLGTDISKVDFTMVPAKLVNIVCKGLHKGYPMWLIVGNGCCLDENVVDALMRGMALGIDVHPFIDGSWNINMLLLIFSYAGSADLSKVVPYISSKFDIDLIKELLDLAVQGIDISRLASVDKEGYPIYNRYQVYEIGRAIVQGIDTEEMYNPELADLDICLLREGIKKSSNMPKKV